MSSNDKNEIWVKQIQNLKWMNFLNFVLKFGEIQTSKNYDGALLKLL